MDGMDGSEIIFLQLFPEGDIKAGDTSNAHMYLP